MGDGQAYGIKHGFNISGHDGFPCLRCDLINRTTYGYTRVVDQTGQAPEFRDMIFDHRRNGITICDVALNDVQTLARIYLCRGLFQFVQGPARNGHRPPIRDQAFCGGRADPRPAAGYDC